MVVIEDAVAILPQAVVPHHSQAQLEETQGTLAGRVPLADEIGATATSVSPATVVSGEQAARPEHQDDTMVGLGLLTQVRVTSGGGT